MKLIIEQEMEKDSGRMTFLVRLHDAVLHGKVRLSDWDMDFVCNLVAQPRLFDRGQREHIDKLKLRYPL
jgi:hypothetical protein